MLFQVMAQKHKQLAGRKMPVVGKGKK